MTETTGSQRVPDATRREITRSVEETIVEETRTIMVAANRAMTVAMTDEAETMIVREDPLPPIMTLIQRSLGIRATRGRSLMIVVVTHTEKSRKCHEETRPAIGETTTAQVSAPGLKQAATQTEAEEVVETGTETEITTEVVDEEVVATVAASVEAHPEAAVIAQVALAAAASSSRALTRFS